MKLIATVWKVVQRVMFVGMILLLVFNKDLIAGCLAILLLLIEILDEVKKLTNKEEEEKEG
jgi:hypothetical protein